MLVDQWRALWSPERRGNPAMYFMDGVRVVGMLAVHFGHIALSQLTSLDTVTAKTRMIPPPFPARLALCGFCLVDTFFVLSGFILVQLALPQLHKSKSFLFKLRTAISLILRRYIRLIGVLAFFVALSGFSPPVDPASLADVSVAKRNIMLTAFNGAHGTCREHWASALLLVSNIVKLGQGLDCAPWTWYIDVDWQLFLFGLVLLVLIPKKKLLEAALIALILSSVGATMGMAYRLNEEVGLQNIAANVKVVTNTPLIDFNLGEVNYISSFYARPEIRACPYLLGMLGGLLWYHRKGDDGSTVEDKQWSCSLYIVLAALIAYSPLYMLEASVIVCAIHHGLYRLAWAILNVVVGYKLLRDRTTWLRRALSSPRLVPLSRLSYTWYHTHSGIVLLSVYLVVDHIKKHYSFVDDIRVTLLLMAISMPITFVLSIIIYLFIELPTRSILVRLVRRIYPCI